MSVRKRTWTTRKGESKEAWIVDCFDKNGVRHITTFQTKGEADDHAAKTRINVKRGQHTAPSKSITVAEACDKWIKRVEADGRERGTIDQYRQHAKLHIIPRIGKVKLANLGAKAEDFRENLLANLSRPMADKVMVSFQQMLKSNKYSHVAQGITISMSKRDKRTAIFRSSLRLSAWWMLRQTSALGHWCCLLPLPACGRANCVACGGQTSTSKRASFMCGSEPMAIAKSVTLSRKAVGAPFLSTSPRWGMR